MQSPSTAGSLRRIGVILVLAAPAAVYVAVLAANAVNMPVGDDFLSIVGFLNRWSRAGRWTLGNMGSFLDQFYSHRIPFPRLEAAVLVSAFGHCDMRALMAVNWIGWSLLLASILWQSRTRWEGAFGLLPVSLVMMQPQGYTNMLVAAGSFGHVWSILSAFWAFHLSRSELRSRNAWAMALAAIAALCTANGLLVFPVVALAQMVRRRRSLALVWLCAGILSWALYLRHYSVADQPFARHAFSPVDLAANAAVMVGAIGSFGTLGVRVLCLAGLVLLVAAALASCTGLRDNARESNAELLQFLFLGVAMTAYARLGWPSEYMVQDRYRPYGVLLVALLYLYAARALPVPGRRVLVAIAVPVALCFSVFSYAQLYASVRYTRAWSEASASDIELGGRVPMPPFLSGQLAEAEEILRQALGDGIFRPPSPLSLREVATIRGLPHASRLAQGPVLGVLKSESVDGYYLEPSGGPGSRGGRRPDFGVIFENGAPLVVPVTANRERFADILAHRSLLSERYGFIMPENCREAGAHPVFAMQRDPGGESSATWRSEATLP